MLVTGCMWVNGWESDGCGGWRPCTMAGYLSQTRFSFCLSSRRYAHAQCHNRFAGFTSVCISTNPSGFLYLSFCVSLSWSKPRPLSGVCDSRHQFFQQPYTRALQKFPHLALHDVPSHVRRFVYVSCACVRTLAYARQRVRAGPGSATMDRVHSRAWKAFGEGRHGECVPAIEHSRRRATHTKRTLAPADSWASGVARGIFGQCTRAPWTLCLPCCLSFSCSIARSISLFLTHYTAQRLGTRMPTLHSFS